MKFYWLVTIDSSRNTLMLNAQHASWVDLIHADSSSFDCFGCITVNKMETRLVDNHTITPHKPVKNGDYVF